MINFLIMLFELLLDLVPKHREEKHPNIRYKGSGIRHSGKTTSGSPGPVRSGPRLPDTDSPGSSPRPEIPLMEPKIKGHYYRDGISFRAKKDYVKKRRKRGTIRKSDI